MGRAEALAVAIDRTGLGAVLARIPAWHGVLVLTYHRIGSAAGIHHDPGLWSATQEQLDTQLRFLARNVEVVSGDELPDAFARRRGRRVALTFDDGYRDNYELAYPVLRSHGLPATFFLATGFLDRPRVAWWDEISWIVRSSPREAINADGWLAAPLRFGGDERDAAARTLLERYWRLPEAQTGPYLDWLAREAGTGRADPAAAASTWMTWEMVREMRAGGMAFGGHTVNHPLLARCTAEVQAREIGGSLARLREQLGEPASLFAYPVGGRDMFDDTTRACLRDAGITHAFSFYGGHWRPGGPDPLDIPRASIGPTITPSRFRALLALPQVFSRPRPVPELQPDPEPKPRSESDPEPEPRPGSDPRSEPVAEAERVATPRPTREPETSSEPLPFVPEPDPVEPGDSPPPPDAGWGGAVRRGVVWSVAAFATSKALSFLSILILARLLTPDEFGVVAAVAAFIALVELGSDLGMKPTSSTSRRRAPASASRRRSRSTWRWRSR